MLASCFSLMVSHNSQKLLVFFLLFLWLDNLKHSVFKFTDFFLLPGWICYLKFSIKFVSSINIFLNSKFLFEFFIVFYCFARHLIFFIQCFSYLVDCVSYISLYFFGLIVLNYSSGRLQISFLSQLFKGLSPPFGDDMFLDYSDLPGLVLASCIWVRSNSSYLHWLASIENFSLVIPHRNSARAIFRHQLWCLVNKWTTGASLVPGSAGVHLKLSLFLENSANENTLRNWLDPQDSFFFFVISFFRWTDYRLIF